MKRKILTIIAIGSTISITLTGCGVNASYKNPASGEKTTYVAEFPDGERVEISAEEAEAIKEAQEELGITADSVYEDIEEEAEEDIEEETKKEPFNINAALGSKKGEYTSLGVKYTIYENGAEIAKFENEHAVISEEVEFEGATYPVVSIGENFIGYETKYTEFEIPSHIKYIRNHAFAGCNTLESLVIPETVEYMSGGQTFRGCSNLKSITFLGDFETDSEWEQTFFECKSLESAIVPESVTDLQRTFSRCHSLVSVSLPNNLKTIGDSAFEDCCLETVIIPDSVEVVGLYAFAGTKIKNIDIPESVKTLYLHAFNGCSELEKLNIPDTVTSYGGSAHPDGLPDLDSLRILRFSNNCNEDLGFYGRFKAPKLELVIFSDSTEEIDENYFQAVEDKSNLTIQVPEKTVDYFTNVFPEINVVAKE